MSKNKDYLETIEIKITDMAEDGAGIGHTQEGMAVFVVGGVYGDTVKAGITKAKKNYAMAEVIEIIEESEHRISEKDFPERPEGSPGSPEERTHGLCPYLDQCGGCAYGKLKYDTQLMLKEKHVVDKLQRIAGIRDPKVKPIIGLAERKNNWPIQYRNKAVMTVGPDGQVGFKEGKSNRVVDCEFCMIQAPTVNVTGEIIRRYIKENKEVLKSRSTRTPVIKSVTVKTSFSTGEVMVLLTLREKFKLPSLEDLCYSLDEAISEIDGGNPLGNNEDFEYSLESVAIEIEGASEKEGKRSKLDFVAGKRTINVRLMSMDFEISPKAFYQVNPLQTKNLYGKVLEYLNLNEIEEGLILDLYCGVGTIGTIIAKNYKGEVLGIESVKDAVIDANRNAVINGVVNERLICGKAEDVLPELVSEEDSPKISAVILDPPRGGCQEKLLEAVVKASPKKIVYVSCNPGTLARDLKYLMEGGYELAEATPVDMFCHGSHVETVVLLSNRTVTVVSMSGKRNRKI